MSDESCFPDCTILHDQFVHCIRPTIQIQHIYKTGFPQDCGEFVEDWKKCMYAKVLNNAVEIKVEKSFSRIYSAS